MQSPQFHTIILTSVSYKTVLYIVLYNLCHSYSQVQVCIVDHLEPHEAYVTHQN